MEIVDDNTKESIRKANPTTGFALDAVDGTLDEREEEIKDLGFFERIQARLKAFLFGDPKEEQEIITNHGAIVVNGVELPRMMYEQMIAANINPETVPTAHLQAGVIEFAKDGVLFDDPNGINFLDKITYTAAERAEDAQASTQWQDKMEAEGKCPCDAKDFVERVTESRQNPGLLQQTAAS